MEFGLNSKFAIITGGSHGIGRAIALNLASEGCNVLICSRNPQRLEDTKNAIKDLYPVDVLTVQVDVLRENSVEKVLKTLGDHWAHLHILINNVGGGGRWGKESFHLTEESIWKDVYEKNAMTAVRFTNACIPYMIKERWGRIINITSIFGKEGGGRPWFNMSKCAEISHMKCMAKNNELVRSGITFNSVAPGAIMIPNTGWSKLSNESPETLDSLLDKNYPLGRLGTPEEVANVVAFICSEKASLVNGSCLTVDGGESNSF